MLELANRLVPRLGGAEKVLRPDASPTGRSRSCAPFRDAARRTRRSSSAIRALDCPLEEAAILARTNARLTDFEEVLHEAGIPFQGASLLDRDAARRLLPPARAVDCACGARRCAPRRSRRAGVERRPTSSASASWSARTTSAGSSSSPRSSTATRPAFVGRPARAVRPRAATGARGVHLLTFHRAKGLEFEAVFLPRLQDKELPSKQARTDDEIAEERRLLYVGLTRAKRVLWLYVVGQAESRFLAELGRAGSARTPAERSGATGRPPREALRGGGSSGRSADGGAAVRHLPRHVAAESDWTPDAQRLREWRLERAKADDVPPYVVFHDTVLHAIAAARPGTLGELAQISGVGPAKLERYGDEVLAIVAG